ncbi:MAG: PASTA domain-containing protein [Bacteroidaceae bacterium]|nr:PASTA domain-containing protein [Bacteroidaceae bacterium]
MTIKEFFSFKSNKFFWWNIIAMVVFILLMLFFIFKGLDFYTHHGEGVRVPNVKGMGVNEASLMLKNHDLVPVVSDSTYMEDKPAGTVLELTPEEDRLVKKGREIRLTINSLSVPLMAVPDVVENSSLREAQVKITASGFKLDSIQFIRGEKDWVYGIKYRGKTLMIGEKVPMGSSLVIVAGDGEEFVDTLRIETPQIVEDSVSSGDDPWF